MKKILSIAICIAIMLQCATASVFAAGLSEDFESYEIGDAKAGFDTFGGKIEGDASNKYAAITGKLTTAGKYVDSATGMVSVSVKLYQTQPLYARAITLWDSARKNRSALIWFSDGQATLSYDNASKQLKLAPVPEKTWISLSLTLDFDTQRINQVYINDIACLSEPMTMLNKDVVISDLGYIEFKTEGADGTMYIDDIEVKTINYPAVYAAIDSASGCLSETEGSEAGMYPASSFTMLKDTLDELKAESEVENLTEEEQNAIISKADDAVAAFKETVILGTDEPMYFNGFENFSVDASISTSDGFVAAKNVKVVAGKTGNAAKLTDSSRLLYQYSKELEGKYYITLSFMQETKTRIDMLLDSSDAIGRGHGPWVYSNGSNIVAKDGADNGEKIVLENYLANQWYDIKVLLSTDDDTYTVYMKKSEEAVYEEMCTCSFPIIVNGDETLVMDKLKRICNVQINSSGCSVIIDNMGLYAYTEPVENRVNSVGLEYEATVANGDAVCVNASVYDRYHAPWSDNNITWTVVSGDATVDAYGNVTVADGYSGMIKIKATADNGIYDYAQILYLPVPEFKDIKKEAKDNTVTVTATYDMLKFVDTEVSATLISKEGETTYGCVADKAGNITAQIDLDAQMPTQELKIVLSDESYGASETISHMHYGSDAMDVLVEKFNESQAPVEVIDEFTDAIGLGVNFAYAKDKEGYAEYIKSKGTVADAEQMLLYIKEANLIFGVKYATRENIEEVMTKGIDIIKAEDEDADISNLSDGELEEIYIEIIGFDAEDVKELCDEIVAIMEEADDSSSSSKPSRVPSFSGGGGGGGGSSSVSVGGAITVVPQPVVTPEATPHTEFEDIKEAMWAKDQIEKLAKLNVLNGYNGKVRPNDYITRAEFSKMVVELFDIRTGGTSEFSDVSSDSWYASYIGAMASVGIINGHPDGRFAPEDKITRQDAAVILNRCIEKLGVPVYTKNERINFTDSDYFADYAADAISSLQTYGVISGRSEGIFDAQAEITRAETAVMLVNLYSFSENK